MSVFLLCFGYSARYTHILWTYLNLKADMQVGKTLYLFVFLEAKYWIEKIMTLT